ncbi:AAA family ATPase [Brachybacterium saurashtrense]|uniref:Kinase n=1 Tax=Brachybacterium saurashtrense TaxID=556288 RepID=A0A345YM92_9MICO|nr:AAA family ATPase [Brachybacterium saurashtrense]AXK45044.1 kinase [Brachybacterium saurashtrense]RRR21728.1 kinase [Brachybacterium saurashtrense]
MTTPRCAPPFVVLRGNSASGKSTIARRVQRALPRGEVAVIGQDHVRRELLWEHDSGPGDTVGLLESMVRHCLGIGRITVLEGIFGAERYHGMFARLLQDAPGPPLVYYLDVSLPETLRRHAGKSIAAHVPAEVVAAWYRPHDVLGVPGELVLGEELDEEAMLERILADLARHG